jgi:hypothetical protein
MYIARRYSSSLSIARLLRTRRNQLRASPRDPLSHIKEMRNGTPIKLFKDRYEVCVRATHIESVAVQGDDGVQQELKWTPWNTPNYRPGVVTATI